MMNPLLTFSSVNAAAKNTFMVPKDFPKKIILEIISEGFLPDIIKICLKYKDKKSIQSLIYNTNRINKCNYRIENSDKIESIEFKGEKNIQADFVVTYKVA